jgi:hypothetical protein
VNYCSQWYLSHTCRHRSDLLRVSYSFPQAARSLTKSWSDA